MNYFFIVFLVILIIIIYEYRYSIIDKNRENYEGYHPQHSPVNVSMFSNALKYPNKINNETLRTNMESILNDDYYNDKTFNYRKNEPLYNIESIQEDIRSFNNASYTILTLHDNYLGNRI